MLTLPLAFLTALVADPLFVASARGRMGDGTMTIDVAGEGGARIDPGTAMGKLSSGRLYVYVKGGKVHSNNRSWSPMGIGAVGVVAHRHSDRLELEMILPAKAGCSGPVRITSTGGGLRAEVACATLPAASPVPSVSAAPPAPKVVPVPVAAPSPKVVPAPVAVPLLKPAPVAAPAPSPKPALVAAPPPSPKPALVAAPAPLPKPAVEPLPAPSVVRQATYRPIEDEESEPVAVDRGRPAPVGDGRKVAIEPLHALPIVPAGKGPAPAVPVSQRATAATGETPAKVIPPAVAGPTKAAPIAVVSDPRSGTASWTWLMALVAIVGLGAAAWQLVEWRRARRKGRIRVLEKRRIGLRRSLIVAQVDGQILLLGAGETGISVLRVMDQSPTVRRQSAVPPAPVNAGDTPVPVTPTFAISADAGAGARPGIGIEESAEAIALRELFGDRTRARWQ